MHTRERGRERERGESEYHNTRVDQRNDELKRSNPPSSIPTKSLPVNKRKYPCKQTQIKGFPNQSISKVPGHYANKVGLTHKPAQEQLLFRFHRVVIPFCKMRGGSISFACFVDGVSLYFCFIFSLLI